jgi:hypothetical protein
MLEQRIPAAAALADSVLVLHSTLPQGLNTPLLLAGAEQPALQALQAAPAVLVIILFFLQ